ncbi:MAG: M48 family metalloprotease [Proteobacteria bacterium]|nr:M48 family metalloprotease [Pseudomonadota bacterium]
MKRLAISCLLICILGVVSYLLVTNDVDTPQGLSFETFYRILGQPLKTVDRSITRALGVNAKDERALGDQLAQYLAAAETKTMSSEKDYVNSVMQELAKQYNPKNLNYRVFIIEGPPNAFAMAGGNIIITTGMLSLLKNESQLVGILGHEKGHVDLGHCIDHMRLQAKVFKSQYGSFFDWYLNLLLNHSFSKFQENEADRFGFETLQALNYDPSALGDSFTLMLNHFGTSKQYLPRPIKDYFTTHPSLHVRAENWEEKAKQYKARNSKPYYIGQENYNEKKSRSLMVYPQEWVNK